MKHIRVESTRYRSRFRVQKSARDPVANLARTGGRRDAADGPGSA